MSMRSPGSAQLAPDGVGTMVNCTVKSEGKKEPCHEALQGSAAGAFFFFEGKAPQALGHWQLRLSPFIVGEENPHKLIQCVLSPEVS